MFRSALFTIAVQTTFLAACGKPEPTPSPPSPPSSPPAIEAPSDFPATWFGEVLIPSMPPLVFVVVHGIESASISIPSQGAKDVRLADFVFNTKEIAFTLPLPGAAANSARFQATPTRPTPAAPWEAEGTLTQNGQTFPVRMTSAAPQPSVVPRPSTSHETRHLLLPSATPGIELAGTLTIPNNSPPPFPAVVFVTGSGPQDRDETIFELKPFAILSEAIASAGVASLRLDDRGVGRSGGLDADTPIDVAAADIAGAVRFLSSDPSLAGLVDTHRIGLIGHSEGALVASMASLQLADAASEPNSPRVAFIASLAGIATPVIDVLVAQQRAMLGPENILEANIDAVVNANRAVLELIATRAPREQVLPAIASAMALAREHAPVTSAGLANLTAEQVYDLNTSPRLASFIAADPPSIWRRVTVPVFAASGSLDVQVAARENLAAFRVLVSPERLTVLEVPQANHLFQRAVTGQVDEYARLPPELSPDLVDGLVAWLRAR